MEVCFLCRKVTRVLTPQLVGTIGGLVDPPADTRSNGITPPTPALIPSEIKHETTDMMSFPEPRPSGYLPQSLPSGTQGMASPGAGGTIPESTTLAYMPDLFHVGYQSSSATPDRKYDFHSNEVKWPSDPREGDETAWWPMKSPLDKKYDFPSEGFKWFSDPGTGDEKTARFPIGSLPAETKNVGSQRPDKRKRAVTPDEGRKMRRTLLEGSQSSESPISKSLPPTHDEPTVDPLRAEDSLSTTMPHRIWHQIPQRTYSHGQKQWDFRSSQPITFCTNGLPGSNMGDALRKRFIGFDGRDDLVLQGAGGSISCRLEVRRSS